MRRRPAPLARAGAGPTQAITGTLRSTTRCASATPSWSSVPAVSICRTTTAPSAFGGVEPIVQIAQQGSIDRSLDLDDLDHRRRRGDGRSRPEGEQRARGEEEGQAAHRPHATDREAKGILGISHGPNRPTRAPRGGPAIQSAGRAAPRARHRHRGVAHRHPHRSAVRRARAGRQADRCAADVARRGLHPDPPVPRALDDLRLRRQDRARHALPRQPRDRESRRHQPDREQVGPGGRGRAVLPTRAAGLDLARPRAGHERGDGRGGAGRIDDHAAAREERHHRRHGADVPAQVPGACARDPRGAALHEGPDPRAVPERRLLRERRLRDRHGGGLLLPRARVAIEADAGRHAGRPRPVAELLRPAGAPGEGARPPQLRPRPARRAWMGAAGSGSTRRSPPRSVWPPTPEG